MKTFGLILGIAPLAVAALLNFYILVQAVLIVVQFVATRRHLRSLANHAKPRTRRYRNPEPLATGHPAVF